MMLRIAFIGAGQMARHHAAAIRRAAVPATIVGVVDRAADRARAFAAELGCHAFPSIDALASLVRPDVVHVCTPPDAHVTAAVEALEHGAHVYVEKPFAPTAAAAERLLRTAEARGLLVCAGHQLLCDPGYRTLMAASGSLGPIVQVDSHFAFRPVGVPSPDRGSRLAAALVDVLPHPLYVLVAALQRCAPGEPVSLAWAHADPADVHATLRAGSIVGRLSVSLRARPVASSLTLAGTGGSLTCDFMRSIVFGAGNPGTTPIEKMLNPAVEGVQLVARGAGSLVRRLRSGTAYAGLPELVDAFYRAVATGAPPPISPDHLRTVTELFEPLVARIEPAARRPPRPPIQATAREPLVVVTGAGGFLGGRLVRALPRVRGVGRAGSLDDPAMEQWCTADLSAGPPAGAVAGADVVVHAAAETAGGYDDHQRNTIDATKNLLEAMHASGVSRLVLVSSLSVLEPPRRGSECQHEGTPRPANARPYGPYTWGKCLQEQLVEREAPRLGIAVRIVRPGALVDPGAPELPGLMGRRLFGRWHLGIGRPGLPIAVCDVDRCAQAIAWCATHFDEAPPVVNLFEPEVATRGAFVARLRGAGWNGRMCWVPARLLAVGLMTARTAAALLSRRLPEPLAAWSILRPRRYAPDRAAALFDAVRDRRPVRVPVDEMACSA